MAEPGRAKAGVSTDIILITWSQANGYGITPPVDSSVVVNGTVQITTPKSCWVWTWVGTTPTNVFQGETGHHVVCTGSNSFQMNEPEGTIVPIQVTAPNAAQPPPPSQLPDIVKGSISVTSMEGGKKEH
jgi:hypothetical protein